MATAYSLVLYRNVRNDCNVGGKTSLRIDTIIKNRTTERTAIIRIGWPLLLSIRTRLARLSRIEIPQSRKRRKPFIHDIVFVSAIVTLFPNRKFGVSIPRPSGITAHVESVAQSRLDAPRRHKTAPGGSPLPFRQCADRYAEVGGEVLSGIL